MLDALLPTTPVGILVCLLVGGLMAWIFWYLGSVFRDLAVSRQVLQHGEDAEATVLELRDTAVRIDRRPVFDVHLEVRQRGRAAYRARTKEHLGRHQTAAWLGSGARLKVKVDRSDASKVAIVGVDMTAPPDAMVIQNLPSAADPVKALKDLQTMLDSELITQDEYAQKKAEVLARL